MTEPEINQLSDTIRETAFSMHNYFKNGFLEEVYL